MELIDRIKQQSALFESIRHWEENKERNLLFESNVDQLACSLCCFNDGDCETCILAGICAEDYPVNPWDNIDTNPTHMINYLKLHQLHSDILIEPGIN
ncbi:hypothetical protein MNBD_ALPHA03-1263 [hydrothermal vent metagenome]|uniref:Uncharacterized protein n=1 Tax=hydrothermal vent metagenome TaxID=652676 RepID=A0A3B1B943_9ZZZZ